MILQVLGLSAAVVVIDDIDKVAQSQRPELLEAMVSIKDKSLSFVKIFSSTRDDSNIFSIMLIRRP